MDLIFDTRCDPIIIQSDTFKDIYKKCLIEEVESRFGIDFNYLDTLFKTNPIAVGQVISQNLGIEIIPESTNELFDVLKPSLFGTILTPPTHTIVTGFIVKSDIIEQTLENVYRYIKTHYKPNVSIVFENRLFKLLRNVTIDTNEAILQLYLKADISETKKSDLIQSLRLLSTEIHRNKSIRIYEIFEEISPGKDDPLIAAITNSNEDENLIVKETIKFCKEFAKGGATCVNLS